MLIGASLNEPHISFNGSHAWKNGIYLCQYLSTYVSVTPHLSHPGSWDPCTLWQVGKSADTWYKLWIQHTETVELYLLRNLPMCLCESKMTNGLTVPRTVLLFCDVHIDKDATLKLRAICRCKVNLCSWTFFEWSWGAMHTWSSAGVVRIYKSP